MYLPDGPPRPSRAVLDDFWAAAKKARPDKDLGEAYSVRWIGLDAASTQQILKLIRSREKTGTFTLPWIVERTGQAVPQAGDYIILIDFAGTPALLVKLTGVRSIKFGEVTADDIVIDGPPVRDLAVWKPLHTSYWNGLLKPFGLSVSSDMPFWAEPFALIYDGAEG